jgi:hypothetical protein
MDKKMKLSNLFFPRARNTDPDTSHMAADEATELATRHHRMIMAVMDQPGTVYDLELRTELDHHQISKRMSELEKMDLVYTDGKKKGAAGRMCRVWVRK